MKLRGEVESGQRGDLSLREDGTVVMGQRLCVPDVGDVRREIMEEAHSSAYAMHPGSTKMYHTLKEHYWWKGMKGVLRFGKRGKLSPRYIGPYRIIERIGEVAYRLELPSDFDRIHDVFHVSMFRNYIPDPSHVLTEQLVEIQENLTYEEEPVQILDRQEQVLRNKTIPLVKVLWRSHTVEEATWEHEEQMKRHYPHLFDAGTNVLISRTKFL